MYQVEEHGDDSTILQPRKRRKRKARKKYRGAAKNMPEFKPEWINALLIMLLHKAGGSQSFLLD